MIIKSLVNKVVKVFQVIIGADEKIMNARIKQAEMKALAKFEIAAGRNAFEQVDTDLIVPQRVVDTIQGKLSARFTDKEVVRSVYELIEKDFDRLFTPELCFDLISRPSTLDNIIQSYVERYVRKQIALCSTGDLNTYFKQMNYLQSLLESSPSHPSGGEEESVIKAAEQIVTKASKAPKVIKAVRPAVEMEERQQAIEALALAVSMPEVKKLRDDSLRALTKMSKTISNGLTSKDILQVIDLICSGKGKLSF